MSRSFLVAAIVVLVCQPVRGDFYAIDVAGLDPGSGHTLRVTGTIDVDVATDVIASSSLSFHHNADAAIPLPSMPSIVGAIDFVDVLGTLFVSPRGGDDQVVWIGSGYPSPRTLAQFWIRDLDLSAGAPSLWMLFEDPPFDSGTDFVVVEGSGTGISIGTAVPEPSAFLYGGLISILAGCGCWVKRRLG